MKKEELIEKYNEREFRLNYANFYGLKYFLNNCIISKDYDFNNLDTNPIILSKKGQELFDKLKKGKYASTHENLIKLAVFLDFYRSELLIDIDKSDYKTFVKSVSNEIINGNLLFPWIYGRTLYDKYYEEFEEQSRFLENEETLRLLKDTPQGVFQMGHQIIGPLGILHTENKRILPPVTEVQLWHCSDPSCVALHTVDLRSARTIISELLFEISEITREEEISEWYDFYRVLCDSENTFYDDFKLNDIPLTLVNSFGENELRLLLKEIIDTKEGARTIIPKGKRFQGASEKIISSLSKAECFQSILLFDSYDLLVATEKLIIERKIFIPSTEVRVSKIRKTGGFFNIKHECNRLGFRAISSDTHLSFIHLRNLILKLYSEEGLKQQLEWNLRFYEAASLKEKVEDYINSEEPRKILKEVVLNGAYQVGKTFEFLPGYFKMPNTLEDEEKMIDKILWKLGFNINIYPQILPVFEKRLTKFKKIIEDNNKYTEADKEKIRSAAVNLFVSLEEILKHTLSFSTWLLLSDHFKVTRFKYNYTEATLFMTERLNGYDLNEDTKLLFDSGGKNTLFPLVEGFRALFGICDSYLDDTTKHEREKAEMPRFLGKTNLIDFPLMHSALVIDIKRSCYQNIREIGLSIPSEFGKNKVLEIRNSLEHDRDDFPLKSNLIKACECISKSINRLYQSGLYPNVYLFSSLNKDKYNRVLKTFEDYNSREIVISELINYKGYPIPSSDSPIVIVPEITFPDTKEPLRIKYEENSEYLFYWRNYPRKKQKLIKKDTLEIVE